MPGIPKSSPPPGSWVPGSVGRAGDINSLLLDPVGPVVGGQLDFFLTQLAESFMRAGTRRTMRVIITDNMICSL